MCSNRTNLAFNNRNNNSNNNNNQIKTTTSAYSFNAINNNKSSLEHVYYAKLVNFDRQRRLSKQNESERDSACKNSSEIDLSQQRNRLRNVPSKVKNINNNTNEYESLVNLDSGAESTTTTNLITKNSKTNNNNNNKINRNEDSRSTSSCCSSSIEKIAEEDVEEEYDDDEYEQEEEEELQVVEQSNLTKKATNSLKLASTNHNQQNKSVIKILEKRKYSNSTTSSTSSSSSSSSAVGSFSSSSASSISSALSSIAINNQLSSSASSSSSSSPNFLSTSNSSRHPNNGLLTDSASSIYSSNYKTRSGKLKSNDLITSKPVARKDDSSTTITRLETFKPSITKIATPPVKPATPPPQLLQQQQQQILDTSQLADMNSNSTTTNNTSRTQTMSSWLQSCTHSSTTTTKQLNDYSEKTKLIKSDLLMNTANTSTQIRRATFSPISNNETASVVSTRENNKLLADKLLKISRMNAHVTPKQPEENSTDENFYCDLNEFSNPNRNVVVETINNNRGVVFRDNCYYVNKTNEIANDYASSTNNNNKKREFYVLNDKNEEEQQVEESVAEEELNDEETTATEDLIDSKQETSQLSTRNFYYDSTLLTPLKPITSSEAKIITTSSSSSSSSSNNSNYETKRVNIKTNKKITTTTTCTSSSSSTNSANIKSASTSYLLSKITSIASLTLPKHNRTATTAPVESLLNSSSTAFNSNNTNNNNNNNPTSPATSTASSSSCSANPNPLSHLATKTQKFFNRKLDDTSETNTHSPCLLYPENHSITQLSMSPSAAFCSNKFSSSVSSSSSSSYIFNQQQQQQQVHSSRRPFKKRSQSSHNNLLNKISWSYNPNEDCWYKNNLSLVADSTQTSPKTTFSSTLKKRKSLNNKIASVVVGTKSMSSFLNSAHTSGDMSDDLTNQSVSPCSLSFTDSAGSAVQSTRVRLIQISLKHLTLVELKYLKQICFNKLQKQFQSLQSEQQKLRKQQLNKSTTNSSATSSTSNNNNNNSNQTSANSFAIRLTIPKDESIKTTKTKSIAIRSKSVDFKFFDEFKENYLTKKSSKDSSQQVFGQSLYKCILNDLEQTSRVNKTGTTTTTTTSSTKPLSKSDSKNNTSLLKGTKKWRSSNQSNILIASKFDLNLLNELNTNENLAQLTCDSSANAKSELTCSKRNSVLFEALDLKNMSCRSLVSAPNDKHQLRSSSISANLLPNLNEIQMKREDLQALLNNQNLSIRSEGLVPNIVKSCCNHIIEYGLDVVGIFRIDSSKKRIKEIKEMYDSGREVQLDESFNPNDSACILKEYLRSLPEPLLTRDLYSSFLATCKIKDTEKRLQSVRLLICLLPVPNRDTLECLLHLLNKVKDNSNKSDESDNQKNTGNKMDAFNLAMVFGPNILKKHKIGSSSSSSKLNDYSSDKYNLIDDIDSVISVTKYLIENHNSLFHIESNLHNELIQTINNLNPSELNAILTRKLISSIGITKLDGLNGNMSDTSGYSSSVKSTNVLVAKSSTDESLSPLNCFSSVETNNQYLSGDFIDYKMCKHRTSRTKLHKIVDNFNPVAAPESEAICFVNSPSHSPTRSQPQQQQQQQQHQTVKHYKRHAKSTLASEIYHTQQQHQHLVDSYLNPSRNNSISSSLLLMIQSNEKTSQAKLAKHNKIAQNNEDLLTKATKSLSNLTQQHQANLIDKRRQSGGAPPNQTSSIASKPPQYKLVNSNTIQICSKFYDKTKYNVIGEQETLV